VIDLKCVKLTPCDPQVLKLLVQGCGNKERQQRSGNRILSNDPCSAPFLPEPFWLVSATKVYSALGADIVVESITTLGIRDFMKRRLSNFLQKLSRWCITQLTNVL
jgi:hypothetical protein